jgi:hypothetical protein
MASASLTPARISKGASRMIQATAGERSPPCVTITTASSDQAETAMTRRPNIGVPRLMATP